MRVTKRSFNRHLPCLSGSLIAALLITPIQAIAQSSTGTISGTIVDSSRAVISDAQVEITNEGTGQKRTVPTSDRGFYTAPNLVPGNYIIRVKASGFSTAVEKNVPLTVGAELVVNESLNVGAQNETVEVNTSNISVDLGSSVQQQIVGQRAIRELPLNGRDWTQLAILEPGVHGIDNQQQAASGSNARANRGWGSQLTISGARPQQNNYVLDGLSINDYSGGGPGGVLGSNLGVDAIQEYSVVVSNPTADYGRSSGGVFNAVTKAGTNQLHGDAYEFIRNSYVDARSYFDGPSPPPFKRNQFGAALGGPIFRNKIFGFGNYEGVRQSLSSTVQDTVPSANARKGVLQCPTSGSVVPTGSGCPKPSASVTQTYQITVDPKVAPYLPLYPLPNYSVSGDTGIATLVTNAVAIEDFFTGRFDFNFSSKDETHVTLLTDDSSLTGPDSFDFANQAEISRRKLLTVAENHIFSPSLANFLRFGVSQSISKAPETLNAIAPGGTDLSLGFVPGHPVGAITVTSLTQFPGIGGTAEYDFLLDNFQLYDDLVLTRGNHSFKFGGDVERMLQNEYSTNTPNGAYTFGSVSNFLQNVPQRFTSALRNALPIALRQTIVGAYALDDWRARPNLALNLGLRYEISTDISETNNRLSTLVQLTDTAPKLGAPLFANPTYKNFSPRVGFAWDPYGAGKTSVRGAFGVYYVLPLIYQFELSAVAVTPFAQIGQLTTVPKGTFPNTAFPLLTANTLTNDYVTPNPKSPYVYMWNVNVQQQLPANTVFQIGYVGSHALHQPFRTSDANIVLPTVANGQYVWPTRGGVRLNPTAGAINALDYQVSAVYHALDVRLIGHSGGSRYGVSYTWSKSIDSGSSSVTAGQFGNSIAGLPLFYPQLRRGVSDFDVPNTFVLNYLYELPKHGFAHSTVNVLVNGWQLNGLYSATSGQPFSVLIGGDPLGMGNGNPFDYPNRVRGGSCSHPVTGNISHYINTSCFSTPTAKNILGDSGRNIARGPFVNNFIASVFKNNHIHGLSEDFNLQLRAEFFNVLNHPFFLAPVSTANQIFDVNFNPISTAGQLTAAPNSPREIQVGAKVIW